jgi:hypothetical protein
MKRILPLVLLAASSAAVAESGVYRVEVIVFRNLAATSEAVVTPDLRSFTQFPDIQDEGTPQEPADEPAAGQQEVPPAAVADVMHGNLPDDLRALTDKSATMEGVWRRLRSSQTYRPLLYAGWEQNRIDYYPPLHIHDAQVIDTQLRPPTNIVVADLTAPDPLAAYRSAFYQLDGSLQLRRSRFLHLFLDLELREPAPQGDAGAAVPGSVEMQPATAGGALAYATHTLRQNRQINTGELQYFDTPYYGTLVYVTADP